MYLTTSECCVVCRVFVYNILILTFRIYMLFAFIRLSPHTHTPLLLCRCTIQVMKLAAKAKEVTNDEIVDRLDKDTRWNAYKRSFFFGKSSEDLRTGPSMVGACAEATVAIYSANKPCWCCVASINRRESGLSPQWLIIRPAFDAIVRDGLWTRT